MSSPKNEEEARLDLPGLHLDLTFNITREAFFKQLSMNADLVVEWVQQERPFLLTLLEQQKEDQDE